MTRDTPVWGSGYNRGLSRELHVGGSLDALVPEKGVWQTPLGHACINEKNGVCKIEKSWLGSLE